MSATLARDWRSAIVDTDGDDTPMLVYCDFLEEQGDEQSYNLMQILRQWVNNKTIIRTLSETMPEDDSDFDKLIRAFNIENPAEDRVNIETRKAWMTGRIGECYTHLFATVEYLVKRPNLLSDQPFRSLTILNSNRSSQSELNDLMTNWRLQKLWHLDIPYYAWWGNGGEMKIVEMIRAMKPLFMLNTLTIRGVRDFNFKISSALIGFKKVAKGCKIRLGHRPEIVV